MHVSDHLRLLVAYDGWATERLLRQTAGLVEAEDGAGASWGSIEGSIQHVVDSHGRWLERFDGKPRFTVAGAGFEALTVATHTMSELLKAFTAELSDADAYEEVHFHDSSGAPHHDYLAVLLSHVVNHGTYHRGEAALMLSRIGRSPGDLDLMVYRRLVEPRR